MNKYILLVLLSIVANTTLFGKNYATAYNLKAAAYPEHVELTWNNNQGFDYEVFLIQGKNFIKRGETKESYFLDFTADLKNKAGEFTYRLVPKGIKPQEVTDMDIKGSFISDATDNAYLDMVQRYTTRYFFEYAHPVCKLARERSNNTKDIVTTGGTGFGIMALIAGAERGYYSKNEVRSHISDMVCFLAKVERFHGAWAHWYDGNTGKVFSFSKYDNGGDLVETAFLVQGLLTARSYFKDNTDEDIKLRDRITALWESVEWSWYTKGTDDKLYWHWSKDYDFKMNHLIRGFDETFITYVLAASSPTYPISASVYEKCFKNSDYYTNGKEYFGIKLDLGMPYGGPLFFTHYSFLGLNPTNLTDGKVNYFDRNKAHVLIHRAYAINNPKKHVGFGDKLWGFTSSDDALVGYSSHHPGTDSENGTVSPTAALSSMPYTPAESMVVLKHLYKDLGKKTFDRYGFYDSYNPSLAEGCQVVKSHLAIDQGPIAVMIENYRSGLVWKLFIENREMHKGLEKLGFSYTK